jgi:predicted GTPase
MGRQTTLLVLAAVFALALVGPVAGDVPAYDSRSPNEATDSQTTPSWYTAFLHDDVRASVDAFVSTVETFARTAFTVVKAVVSAIHTVVVAVAKVVVLAAVKIVVVVGQWLLQVLFG